MKFNSFLYSLRQGLKNILRNKFYSLASLATMVVCIFMFGIFTAIVVNVNHVVREAEKGVAVVAYFDEGVTDDQIAKIGDFIRSREEVENVTFVSAEEAWQEFMPIYFGTEDPDMAEDLAQDFAKDNPLANSANYQIYLKDVSKQDQLVKDLSQVEGIREVSSNNTVADTLTNFNSLLGYLSIGIIVLLFAVAVFLISNTVAVGIAVRKEEIGIMKLIGATDFFIRAPFIIEGVVIGLIGSGVPLIILYVLYQRMQTFVSDKFGMLTGILSFIPAGEIFRYLVPVSLCIGVGIGFLGSMLTIRKHLKV